MELFEALRVPIGPFFLRLDVRKASKRLEGWDESFHKRLLHAVDDMKDRGLPVYFAFVISDEINVLVGEVFSRRLEKIVSVFSSIASIRVGMPLDARVVYTPSLLSAITYLRRRQELGGRNAILKEAFDEAFSRLGDRRKAHAEVSEKPLDKLRKEYARKVPKRALYGSIRHKGETRIARPFGSEKGARSLLEILKETPLERYEELVRNRV